MAFFRQYWTQIRAQLEGMTFSQKWLIGALVMVLLLVGFLVVLYAGQPETVPIGGFAGGRSQQVMARLRGAGIEADYVGGQLRVPKDQQQRAIGMLVEGDLLSGDISEAFEELLDRQSPWTTDWQNRQAYLLAKQRVLGQILGKMQGVDSANVILSMPRDSGFGSTNVKPNASVSLWMRGDRKVPSHMIDAVARLVAGAIAEMTPQDVAITDGNSGVTRTVRDADAVLPTQTLKLERQREKAYRSKLNAALSYIPGVIVAVNVRIDPVARQSKEDWQYMDAQPLESEQSESITRRNVRNAGQPGTQSNTGMSIEGEGGAGTVEQIERTQTSFDRKQLVGRSQSTLSGHQVQQINATINVPRRYFVQIYKSNNPDAGKAPTTEELQPVVDAQLQKIQSQVEPLVQAKAKALVRAHMIPDKTLLPTGTPDSPPPRRVMTLVSGWAKPVGLSALALVGLAMMLWMVRNATRQEELPSVEQMTGLPPQLEGEEELVGEADQGEGAMAGVELNDEELNSRRVAEQISDMIKNNPDEAGALLNRWVRVED